MLYDLSIHTNKQIKELHWFIARMNQAIVIEQNNHEGNLIIQYVYWLIKALTYAILDKQAFLLHCISLEVAT